MIKINDIANMRKMLVIPQEQYEANPIIVDDRAVYVVDLKDLLSHACYEFKLATQSNDSAVAIYVPQGECWTIMTITWQTSVTIPTSLALDVRAPSADYTRIENAPTLTPGQWPVQLPWAGPLVLREGWAIVLTPTGIIASTSLTLRLLVHKLRSP